MTEHISEYSDNPYNAFPPKIGLKRCLEFIRPEIESNELIFVREYSTEKIRAAIASGLTYGPEFDAFLGMKSEKIGYWIYKVEITRIKINDIKYNYEWNFADHAEIVRIIWFENVIFLREFLNSNYCKDIFDFIAEEECKTPLG